MRMLVTAGPTREFIDDVRFLSNPSTGKMGYAVAEEAISRGHDVVLISGPTCLSPPPGATFVPIVSAQNLADAVEEHFPSVDALVMTAAVADYRPATRARGKLKKEQTDLLRLELVRTTDVLKTVSRKRTRQVLVGFAVESEAIPERGLRKLTDKGLDLLVANGVPSFGANETVFWLCRANGEAQALGIVSKQTLAGILLDEIQILAAR